MGFDQPLWRKYREEFPLANGLIYLNHAGVSPLCRRAAQAMRDFSTDAEQYGSLNYDQWMAAYEGVRVETAGLIGAHRDEIAIVKNTSEGIATIAMGIDWRPGDKIVCFREEFPANYFPWQRVEQKHGARIEWLSIHDPLDRVDQACQGARLLAISFVQYLSGFRADVNAIGEVCKRRGAFYFVDAIQGMGVFPLDVNAGNIDALAADGHKWMLGPEGCGVLYVRRERQDEVDPAEFGWTNVAGYNDYASRDLTLRNDAGRYECGTLNTVGCFGLHASLQLLREIGTDCLTPAIQALGDQLEQGARMKGYEVLGSRTPDTGAGIVSLRKPGIDSRQIVRQLKDHQVMAAPRQGWVRCSPHFYISPEQIDRVLELLP